MFAIVGLTSVIVGIGCLILLPLPLIVIAGSLMEASGSTLLILGVVGLWMARGVWRWLTAPGPIPNADLIHTPRGTRPEAQASPQRKDEPAAVQAASRSSLDDPEDDEAGWDLP